MRYKTKYPNAKVGDEPEPNIIQSGRYFSCDFADCRAITPWRLVTKHGYEMPCCSEDCREILEKQYEENP